MAKGLRRSGATAAIVTGVITQASAPAVCRARWKWSPCGDAYQRLPRSANDQISAADHWEGGLTALAFHHRLGLLTVPSTPEVADVVGELEIDAHLNRPLCAV